MSAVDQKVGWALSAASVSMLHVDQALRHVNLIVWLEHEIVLGMAFFDHPLKIDSEILAVFTCDLDLAFIGEIAKAAGANDGFADREILIRRHFFGSLRFDL